MASASARKPVSGRWLTWSGFALVLALAPLVLTSSLALNMLSQIGCLIIICLSYNMKLGHGGMLSFGHAVYTGLGGFATVHLVNYVSGHGVALPLVVVPVLGGLWAALVSVFLGYVSTKKAGTTFAMISLGIGQLVASIAVMLPGLFGGDAGISINRSYGQPFLGLTFGPQIQVYYLIAVYCFVCTALMYAFTGTPLGRMLNAVRDNPERVGFIGYDTQLVRWFAFILSGFFAGIGGALVAINFEIINAMDALGMMRSGAYLLFTFLGGATVFFGPIIGAVLMVLASVLLSELTAAWLLYLGLIFLLMVMYAPGGVASLVMINVRMARFGRLGRFWGLYAALLTTGAVMLLGVSALIEMIYHAKLNAAMGSEVKYLGMLLDTATIAPWIAAAAVALAGGAALNVVRRRFVRACGQAQEEIEAELKAREQGA